jgi:hypothetical protein
MADNAPTNSEQLNRPASTPAGRVSKIEITRLPCVRSASYSPKPVSDGR